MRWSTKYTHTQPQKCHPSLCITSIHLKAQAEESGRTQHGNTSAKIATTVTYRDDGNDDLPRVFAITPNAALCYLNDVTMTSPELKLPRGVGGELIQWECQGEGNSSVLLMAQHDVMEAEKMRYVVSLMRGRPK